MKGVEAESGWDRERSVVEHLLCTHGVLDLIPSVREEKERLSGSDGLPLKLSSSV